MSQKREADELALRRTVADLETRLDRAVADAENISPIAPFGTRALAREFLHSGALPLTALDAPLSALATLEVEVRRLLVFGTTHSDEATAARLDDVERAIWAALTVRAHEVAGER